MWVEITNPRDIRKVEVGGKLRVNGRVVTLSSHYTGEDYGFNAVEDMAHGHNTFGWNRWELDTVEKWVEDEHMQVLAGDLYDYQVIAKIGRIKDTNTLQLALLNALFCDNSKEGFIKLMEEIEL